ncbi:F-box protein At5g18160 [Lolium perenne]|uniref:F-box protein At5g18160 n=1 Tax=Lolium perenne TaxID=4522 RepID=UPI0021F53A59|nr:F-box protein At5g18160-like [Lolium perenne]
MAATAFDDLPEMIITQEIFMRLPSRDVLQCSAVSRSWRVATTNKEFLLKHYSRQPSLPLVFHKVSPSIYEVEALDIREAPAKRWHVLDPDMYTAILASCDGLVLLSLQTPRFSVVNPVTHQRFMLPGLKGAGRCNVKAMYPHPRRSGEYQILFWRGERELRGGYQILTVGSSKNQKPRCIGWYPVASACTRTVYLLAGRHSYMWRPPILLNGCLHWSYGLDRLLIFDTLKESFRSMRPPIAARGSCRYLLEMEGRLVMRCIDDVEGIMQTWVLQDYERVTWSLRCQIEFPVAYYGTIM